VRHQALHALARGLAPYSNHPHLHIRMPTSNIAQVVVIEGPDALAFAQNQFTSRVTNLPNGQWHFSSWLDAQGRVRALFHLARLDDQTLLVLLRGGDAREFADALRRFVFRSRVTLTAKDGLKIARGAALPMHLVDAKNDVICFGCGSHSMHVGSDLADDDTWQWEQLQEGWPWLPNDALNEVTPPSLSLHRLGAIALDKGCYPGQEIVARLHYRGGNKRHLHRVQLSKHVADGALLQRDHREFMRLLNVVSRNERFESLAVITDDVADNLTFRSENTSDDGVAITLLNAWQD
jgi:tRNA-modifying protein YgfZ